MILKTQSLSEKGKKIFQSKGKPEHLAPSLFLGFWRKINMQRQKNWAKVHIVNGKVQYTAGT